MSTAQRAATTIGDESYAGSATFFRLRDAVNSFTGLSPVIPARQGRTAERILFSVMCRPGHVEPNDTHFDTTRPNVEFTHRPRARPTLPRSRRYAGPAPFKGDMDAAGLERVISLFSVADACTFSAREDPFAIVGGLLCTNDARLTQQEKDLPSTSTRAACCRTSPNPGSPRRRWCNSTAMHASARRKSVP